MDVSTDWAGLKLAVGRVDAHSAFHWLGRAWSRPRGGIFCAGDDCQFETFDNVSCCSEIRMMASANGPPMHNRRPGPNG